MTTIAFDYAVRTRAKRPAILFVRDQSEFEIPSLSDTEAPVVATYETVVVRIDLRSTPDGLFIAAAPRGPLAGRRPVIPFPELLVFGSKPAGSLSEVPIASSDREESLAKARRLTGRSICVGDVVHRPTEGLVITRTASGHPVVTSIEKLRLGRSFDPNEVHDIADASAPECRGLVVFCSQRATGSWDRSTEKRLYDCESILRGLHGDLLDVDDRLIRRWTKAWQAYRKYGPLDEVVTSCEELLVAFRKRGFGARAERLLGRTAQSVRLLQETDP